MDSAGGAVGRRYALAAAAAAAAALAACAAIRARRRHARRGYTVGGVMVYPLKSGAEVKLDSETVLARGFERDRLFQVTDGTGKFVTPRDSVGGGAAVHPRAAELFHIRCDLTLGSGTEKEATSWLTLTRRGSASPRPLVVQVSEDTPSAKPIVARVLGVPRPGGEEEALVDFGDPAAAWLQEATGIQGCRLHGIGARYRRTVVANPDQGDAPISADRPVNLADEAPFLLTSESSLADLKRRLFWSGHIRTALRVDMRRFRPNLVICGTLPWEEDTWKRIRIGKVEFQVWQRCGRCVMTTFCRDTLQRDSVLQVLRTFRSRPSAAGDAGGASSQSNFGMHLIPVAGHGARIAVGDEVEVLERDPLREREWLDRHGPVWKLGLKFALGLPGAAF